MTTDKSGSSCGSCVYFDAVTGTCENDGHWCGRERDPDRDWCIDHERDRGFVAAEKIEQGEPVAIRASKDLELAINQAAAFCSIVVQGPIHPESNADEVATRLENMAARIRTLDKNAKGGLRLVGAELDPLEFRFALGGLE